MIGQEIMYIRCYNGANSDLGSKFN